MQVHDMHDKNQCNQDLSPRNKNRPFDAIERFKSLSSNVNFFPNEISDTFEKEQEFTNTKNTDNSIENLNREYSLEA